MAANVQWFPIYEGSSAQFENGDLGQAVDITFALDTFPAFWYGLRVVVSYELPAEFWRTNYGFKQLMNQGGVPLDMSTKIELTQQNITRGSTTVHTATVTGANGVNWHPFTVPYPFRGGNNVILKFRRLSSFPELVDDQGEVIGKVAPTVHATLLMARGVEKGATSAMPPPPAGSG